LRQGHALARLDSVVLSPHVGGITQNGARRALEMAMASLESFAAGDPTHTVVRGTRW
jgi:phosphoglycerate dehydrogenase-like enzyme